MVKLQIPAEKTTPTPPISPTLGQVGISIMGFTKEFNAHTADQAGLIIPVAISVYEDRSFAFVTKTPPAAVLLRKVTKIEKSSDEPSKNRVARVPSDQVKEVAKLKMENLNAANAGVATHMVEETVRSMGITVE